MILESITLTDFRNYEALSLRFDPQTNIIYGQNAQGKTNILEAAYVSGTSKSHRGSREREMIRFGCEEAHIKSVIRRADIEQTIDIHLKKGGKKAIAINRIPVKRAAELLGIVHIIFFSPEDLTIIKNAPQMRRRFMDVELCQLDKIYLSDLNHYNKILSQRSQLLKDMYYHPDLKDTLSVWDEQLIEYGCRVIRRRQAFIEELAPVIHEMHSKISGGKESVKVTYDCNVSVDAFAKALKDAREKDERMTQTSVGPHRDDLKFTIDGVDIRRFGSQGQQRTCALSLKLSEIYIVKKNIHDTPVLLLDDVLSELDRERQNLLLENLNETQTIITCTGLDDFVRNRFHVNKVFEVVNGHVTGE